MLSARSMCVCLMLLQHTAHYCAVSPLYLHMLANKVSCRIVRRMNTFTFMMWHAKTVTWYDRDTMGLKHARRHDICRFDLSISAKGVSTLRDSYCRCKRWCWGCSQLLTMVCGVWCVNFSINASCEMLTCMSIVQAYTKTARRGIFVVNFQHGSWTCGARCETWSYGPAFFQ